MSRLFKRNNKTTIAELEEYYANQNRRKAHAGKAWLMAFVSLFITLAVIAMLFFGGRWLYRTLTDNDSNSTPSSEIVSDDGIDLPTFDGDIAGQGNQNESDDSTTESSKNTGVVSDEAATTSIPNTDRVTEAGADSDSEIPNTGAGEVLIALPLALAIAGYFVSRKRMIKSAE